MQVAKQFILFAMVGIVGTSGHYLALILLVYFFCVNPVLASAIGFSIGAFINYILNYKFTFRSQAYHHITLKKFMTVALFGALINTIIMWLGVEAAQIAYIIVQVIATSIVLILNFILNKFWTFSG